MKKIFRMALVFALAGATLMYTGCTKDYDEDINAANQKIDAIANQHAADVAALKNDLSTAVSNLESAYKKADDAVTAAYKAADADLQKAIDANKAAIDANAAAIAENKKAIEEAGDAIDAINEELKTFATKEELAGAKKELTEALAAEKKALEEKIAAEVKTLTDSLNAVKARLTAVADDLGKQITDLDGKFTTALAAQKTDLEGQISTALATAIETAKTELGKARTELDAALAVLNSELRSIVFVPELYYAGVEASAYTYTTVNPKAMVLSKGESHDISVDWFNKATFTFPKDEEISFGPDAKAEDYTLGQVGYAQYNLNPSTFNVEDASWALAGKNYPFLVRADEEEPVWAPVFKSISAEGGVATVRYIIENPELLSTSVYQELLDDVKPFQNGFDNFLKTNDLSLEEAVAAAEDPEAASSWFEDWVGDFTGTLEDILNAFFGDKGYDKDIAGLRRQLKKLQDKTIKDITKSIDQLKGQVRAIGRAQNRLERDIELLENQVESMAWDLFFQKWQIAELYTLATANYEGVGEISSMNLTATLEGGRTISSDYEAIVPNPEFFKALAFAKASKYTTNWWYSQFCNAGSHLYLKAYDAVVNNASVPVAYDKNLNLNFIRVHMSDAIKGEYETTLADLQEVYPDLKFEFSLVDYTFGANKTSESAYGKIDNGVFYPMTVDAEGNQIAPASAKNGGISSVGKKPVVLVKLFDGKTLVLAGYFKIEIVKEVGEYFINFPKFGTIPFICGDVDLTTTWAQFSSLVVEDLGITYGEFLSSYQLNGYNYWGQAGLRDLVQGQTVNAVVYVLDKDGKYVATKEYGTIEYGVDKSGTSVNDAFTWTIDNAAAKKIGAGKEQTVYVKFQCGEYEVLYVSFSAKVAEAASFDFGANKIQNEWYTEINDEEKNTVKVNVHVPSAGEDYLNAIESGANARVLDYSRCLDHYFIGYKPSIDFAEGVDDVYKTLDPTDKTGKKLLYENDLQNAYAYSFCVEQPKVGNYQLGLYPTVDPTTKKVTYDDQHLYAIIPAVAPAKDPSYKLVATIDDDNNIVYNPFEPVAKEILNLFPYNATEQDQMVYANIHVDVTYGNGDDCAIDAGTEEFHARFLRPLEITWGAEKTIEESPVGGADINLVDFLSTITDWNNQAVIRKATATDKNILEGQTLVENVIKGVNMYQYYGFEKLIVDLDKVARDNFDADPAKKGIVKEVTPEAKLEFVNPGVATKNAEGKYELDIDELSKFFVKGSEYIINYKNDEAYITTFNLYFPVTVTYAWGEINGTLVVKIKNTSETK